MIYAYSERFMLVFSHDEVVHGKSSMIGKMPGTRDQKFANLRLSYAYMMTHPGKKLLFMGQELGEFDEWNEARQVQWELLNVPEHEGVANLVKALNELYLETPALYELDGEAEGFEWINSISAQDCVLTYLRKGKKKEDTLVVAANFSGIPLQLKIGVPYEGGYKEILNTDEERFGGMGLVNSRIKKTAAQEWDDRPFSIKIKLAPLSLSILSFKETTKK